VRSWYPFLEQNVLCSDLLVAKSLPGALNLFQRHTRKFIVFFHRDCHKVSKAKQEQQDDQDRKFFRPSTMFEACLNLQ
jgi:hypothetical protein